MKGGRLKMIYLEQHMIDYIEGAVRYANGIRIEEKPIAEYDPTELWISLPPILEPKPRASAEEIDWIRAYLD